MIKDVKTIPPVTRVVYSDRRTLSVEITRKGAVVLRLPRGCPDRVAADFVREKRSWMEKHMAARPTCDLPPFTDEERRALAGATRRRLSERLPVLATRIGVTYGRVSVHFARTRFGSCSGKGNLNFHALLSVFPPEVAEYIMVHELCHRRHMDHSRAFWEEVYAFCPDAPAARRYLKGEGRALLMRLQ